ncbi:MAG: DNA repair protein [Rickettsia endosymbiont of Ecitomorpha arachnoides]|nr:DNA repair protein [Rickettsia endosymbiont of Sceptobius lativentris]MCC8461937.1 DNA repair protein [Rickettsia endosymbiont of Ecitomorpha arachnoides]
MLENNLIEFSNDDTPHYIGHRKRVKERFVAAGAEHFSDYELLEVMLFSAIPRKDVKPLAKKLLDHFDITDLINLDKERLLSIKGTNENLYINFALIRELINRVLKQKIINKNIIAS